LDQDEILQPLLARVGDRGLLGELSDLQSALEMFEAAVLEP
jgi:hypothetical protein